MSDDVIVVSGPEPIKVADLHIRYIPMANLEQWYLGAEPMLLGASPHVELLTMYKNGTTWEALLSSRYAEERRARRIKHGQEKWSEGYIKKHIANRISTYESLKKEWRPGKGDKPIMVLATPFWKTRYGLINDAVVGPEIWNGAGRCAAAYVLGWETISGVWVKDTRPGANECERIERKFRP